MPTSRRRTLGYVLGAVLLAALSIPLGHLALKSVARYKYEAALPGQRSESRVGYLPGDSILVRNPVFETGQDPWIAADTLPDGRVEFLYVYAEGDTAIALKRGPSPFLFDDVAAYTRWVPGPDDAHGQLANLWAPELHRVGGEWVIYFAANDGSPLVAGTHLSYALRAIDNDPRAGFAFAGELALPDDAWAIDATVLRVDGQDYFVWSGWRLDESLNQYLYICRMADAFTPAGPRVEISAPVYDWELRGRRAGLWPSINEGPVQLDFQADTYLAYSASGSWSDDYAVGALRLRRGADPMQAGSWEKRPEPILSRTADVLGPGHNCFLRYGSALLAFHHAAKYSRAAWDREVFATPVHADADGWPIIGPPRHEVRLASAPAARAARRPAPTAQ